jgi:hypothetical protein
MFYYSLLKVLKYCNTFSKLGLGCWVIFSPQNPSWQNSCDVLKISNFEWIVNYLRKQITPLWNWKLIIIKCPNLQMYFASHPSTNVNYHLTKNHITKIIEGSTCDDATSPKGRVTSDVIRIIVNLSTKSQLGMLST